MLQLKTAEQSPTNHILSNPAGLVRVRQAQLLLCWSAEKESQGKRAINSQHCSGNWSLTSLPHFLTLGQGLGDSQCLCLQQCWCCVLLITMHRYSEFLSSWLIACSGARNVPSPPHHYHGLLECMHHSQRYCGKSLLILELVISNFI